MAIAIVTISALFQENKRLRTERRELTDAIKIQRDTITRYKNENGNLVAQVKTLEIGVNTLRTLAPDLQPILSQFAGINKRLTNVESLMGANLQATKSFDIQAYDSTVVIDNTERNVWAFDESDRYFSLSGYVVPEGKRVFATPSLTIDIAAAEIRGKRPFPWLFQKRPSRFELTTTNPYVKIDSVGFTRIKE